MTFIQSNDSFLSKCLKQSENKYTEKDKKDKSRFNKDNELNVNIIQNKISNNNTGKNIFINITNINNSPEKVVKKKKYYKTNTCVSLKRIATNKVRDTIESKTSQQLKGIFSLINKFGYSEDKIIQKKIILCYLLIKRIIKMICHFKTKAHVLQKKVFKMKLIIIKLSSFL